MSMNYVGSVTVLDRGDAPAQAVIDQNARSLAQRVADETRDELEKVLSRVENIYGSFEMTSEYDNDANLEYVNDIAELEELIRDQVKKRKYQQQVTIFVVGFQDVCGQKLRLLQQVNEFFMENSKSYEEEDWFPRTPDIDLDDVADKIDDSLKTAHNLTNRLGELNKEIVDCLAAYAEKKATNRGKKKLEKALQAAKDEVGVMHEKLLIIQTEIDEKEEKTQALFKQLEVKNLELQRYKTAAEVAKKNVQDSERLQADIKSRDEKIQELRQQVNRLEIEVTSSNHNQEMSQSKLESASEENQHRIVQLTKEVEEGKLALDEAQRDIARLHEGQMSSLKENQRTELEELRNQHNLEIQQLTEELEKTKQELIAAQHRAASLELDKGERSDTASDVVKHFDLDPSEPPSQATTRVGSRQESRSNKSSRQGSVASKKSGKSPSRQSDSKPGSRASKKEAREYAETGVQDQDGNPALASVEKSKAPSSKGRRSKAGLAPVQETDAVDLENAFDLLDDAAWSSVSGDQIPGRFAQYRKLCKRRVAELEEQLQLTQAKTQRKVLTLKAQFQEHKGKWEAERKLLIEQVSQAHKLQNEAEKEADAAMTQLEEFINEQEKLEHDEEVKRKIILRKTDAVTTETKAAGEEGETTPGPQREGQETEQDMSKLMQQTDDAKKSRATPSSYQSPFSVCSSLESVLQIKNQHGENVPQPTEGTVLGKMTPRIDVPTPRLQEKTPKIFKSQTSPVSILSQTSSNDGTVTKILTPTSAVIQIFIPKEQIQPSLLLNIPQGRKVSEASLNDSRGVTLDRQSVFTLDEGYSTVPDGQGEIIAEYQQEIIKLEDLMHIDEKNVRNDEMNDGYEKENEEEENKPFVVHPENISLDFVNDEERKVQELNARMTSGAMSAPPAVEGEETPADKNPGLVDQISAASTPRESPVPRPKILEKIVPPSGLHKQLSRVEELFDKLSNSSGSPETFQKSKPLPGITPKQSLTILNDASSVLTTSDLVPTVEDMKLFSSPPLSLVDSSFDIAKIQAEVLGASEVKVLVSRVPHVNKFDRNLVTQTYESLEYTNGIFLIDSNPYILHKNNMLVIERENQAYSDFHKNSARTVAKDEDEATGRGSKELQDISPWSEMEANRDLSNLSTSQQLPISQQETVTNLKKLMTSVRDRHDRVSHRLVLDEPMRSKQVVTEADEPRSLSMQVDGNKGPLPSVDKTNRSSNEPSLSSQSRESALESDIQNMQPEIVPIRERELSDKATESEVVDSFQGGTDEEPHANIKTDISEDRVPRLALPEQIRTGRAEDKTERIKGETKRTEDRTERTEDIAFELPIQESHRSSDCPQERLLEMMSKTVRSLTGQQELTDDQKIRSQTLVALAALILMEESALGLSGGGVFSQLGLLRTEDWRELVAAFREELAEDILSQSSDAVSQTPDNENQKTSDSENLPRQKSTLSNVSSHKSTPPIQSVRSGTSRKSAPSSAGTGDPKDPNDPEMDPSETGTINRSSQTPSDKAQRLTPNTDLVRENTSISVASGLLEVPQSPAAGKFDNTEEEIRASSARSRASLRNQFRQRLEETKKVVDERRTKSPGITIPTPRSMDEDELVIEDDDDVDIPLPDDLKEYRNKTMEIGTSPPPGLTQEDSHVSVQDVKFTPTLSEHPVVQDFIKVYDGVVQFKDALTKILVNKDMMSASQILSDLDTLKFDKSAKIKPQITNMTYNIYFMLEEIAGLLTSVLVVDREPMVSSLMNVSRDPTKGTLMRDETEASVHQVPTRGSQRSDVSDTKTSSTVKELQDQYHRLTQQFDDETRKHEEQHRHNTVVMMEMQDTINELQRELSTLGRTAKRSRSATPNLAQRSPQLASPETSIMFTRLDSERNAKIMKKAVMDDRLGTDRYKEAVTQMNQYVSLPAQRLAHLVSKYVHHCRMKAIEENVKKSESLSENVFEVLDKMEALQNERARKWAEHMDDLGSARLKLASDLMETLDSIEQESGLFLIKPMYSFRGREMKQKYVGKLSRPVRPRRAPPSRENVSALAPAPTPSSNIRHIRDERIHHKVNSASSLSRSRPEPLRPLEGDSSGLAGASMAWVGQSPRQTWSFSSSQAKNVQGDPLNLYNTPRILELDINRMLIGQNNISSLLPQPVTEDRLVNASQNNLRSYVTVNRPVASPTTTTTASRPRSSGTPRDSAPPTTPQQLSSAGKKKVRVAETDLEMPSSLKHPRSPPLPPISAAEPPNSPSGSSERQTPPFKDQATETHGKSLTRDSSRLTSTSASDDY